MKTSRKMISFFLILLFLGMMASSSNVSAADSKDGDKGDGDNNGDKNKACGFPHVGWQQLQEHVPDHVYRHIKELKCKK